MNFYNNGDTGLSTDNKALWPSYSTIKNCTAMNNADRAMEDSKPQRPCRYCPA